jgi:DNA-binding protein YbaB
MNRTPNNMDQDPVKELRRQQSRLKAIRKKIGDSTTKVSSKDRMVTVTMGPHGGLESIEFNSQKFRKMAPAELGTVLVETIRQAQVEARESVLRAYRPVLPDAIGIDSILAGKTDVDQLFNDAIRQASELTLGRKPQPAAANGKAANGNGFNGNGSNGNGSNRNGSNGNGSNGKGNHGE